MELGLDKYQAQLEKLAKLPKAARLGVAPALCAVVFGLYGYLLFLPARAERSAAREQQLQLQRRLAEVRAVAGNEAQVKEEIAALDRRLKEALRQLPNDKELPGLLTDVSSLGKNAGLDFRSFKPNNEVRKAFYAEVPIDLEFTGRYHDIARFFDDISRLPRIVNMGEMQVSIARESAEQTFLKVKGKATTFRFIEE
ncbi:MAG TPA: type 4a pilus biogenesis protein PilO, partial [Myxococcota bacterium]|nr:type 4a pilus biogenesis protein PilO [Myxococcota bacterium]